MFENCTLGPEAKPSLVRSSPQIQEGSYVDSGNFSGNPSFHDVGGLRISLHIKPK